LFAKGENLFFCTLSHPFALKQGNKREKRRGTRTGGEEAAGVIACKESRNTAITI